LSCCDHDGFEPQIDDCYRRVLWAALAVNVAMFLVEIVASIITGSVSVRADALDFLADAANYTHTVHGPDRTPDAPMIPMPHADACTTRREEVGMLARSQVSKVLLIHRKANPPLPRKLPHQHVAGSVEGISPRTFEYGLANPPRCGACRQNRAGEAAVVSRCLLVPRTQLSPGGGVAAVAFRPPGWDRDGSVCYLGRLSLHRSQRHPA
jgi:hypothetical protein